MKNILIIAAHPDDEILGCGGTISKFKKEKKKIYVYFTHEGSSSRYKNANILDAKNAISKRKKMALNAAKFLNYKIVEFGNNPNLRNDNYNLLENVKNLTKVINKIRPNLIITHHPDDINEDHQFTFKTVSNAVRPPAKILIKEIYLMEIPSTTDWTLRSNFKPNVFIDITKNIDNKIKALKFYTSEFQKYPHSRSEINLKAHSIYRGAQVGLKNVEAFELYRLIE